ncbi:MAG: Ger(x)C family spore germination protein [Firmicutes bacterium]|nr:Ger(x)C family spore germination protein [Bacillota bacterium]
MKRKHKLFLVILFCSFFLGGCYNYRELETLAIVTGLSIDKVDNQYQVGTLIANSKKQDASSKEGQSQTIVYTGTGNSVTEAFYNIDLKSPKRLYVGHMAVIVISEDIAKTDLLKITDIMLRSPESRKKFYLVVSRGVKASDILKVTSPLESYPSQNVSMNLKNTATYQGIATDITYSEFLATILEPGINPTLPSITIKGDEEKGAKKENLEQTTPETKVIMDTLSIFKDDKLVGYTTKEESRVINILNNRTQYSILMAPYQDTYISEHISDFKVKKKAVLKNGKPEISIQLSAKGSINEFNADVDLNNPEEIDKLKKLSEKQLKQDIIDSLEKTQQKYHSDIYGFGAILYRKYPDYYKKNEKRWDEEIYPHLDVKVKVSLDLETKGSLEQTIRRAKDGKTS